MGNERSRGRRGKVCTIYGGNETENDEKGRGRGIFNFTEGKLFYNDNFSVSTSALSLSLFLSLLHPSKTLSPFFYI